MMQPHFLSLAPSTTRASAALSELNQALVSGGVLEPRGPVGAGNAQILLNSLAIMLMIVVPTLLATIAFAWWFRASNSRATYRPDWTYSGRVELIVWGIPLLVVLFLSGVIWIGSHDLDPARPLAGEQKPLEIQVVSLDWKWLFIYPEEGVASVNEIAVPADRPVHFTLTSATVMNMFFVPQLGSMIATMNGMVTELHLKADRPGSYYGLSAQYSGAGFADMHFLLRALPPESFAQWTAEARKSGTALDENAYLALARERAASPPRLYGSIDRALFEKVAARRLQSDASLPAGHAEPME
ncbi:ubiquinol oxidase subunit II [Methylocystis bryophila]|uniref:Ubiquinol oxidase subunit 2 n=1 Tax=Methylocystis bryophila TaxID=655015 RepID=A0A1W6MTN4_9HYPH|nr:ubiquinol oxidase subunit II [Methylocystis bryophila]ARN80971.1 ubiquinol oxidase subunit II [Methylocystis bryophila]BDV36878.1 cytochrome ubiquinol oxidase subunit II [Methylocystis bryophila]